MFNKREIAFMTYERYEDFMSPINRNVMNIQ